MSNLQNDLNLARSIHEKNLLNACTGPYDVAIDVGAHVGLWTNHLAARSRLVYSFEPNPTTYDLLVKNAAANAITIPSALGTRCGLDVLRMAPETPGHSHLGPDHPMEEFRNQPWIERTVPILMLDACQFNGKVDFIKIDTEGSEVDVLVGAANTLLECRPTMMIEIHRNSDIAAIESYFMEPPQRLTYSIATYLFGK